MVEGARLESVCASNRTVSSNLILSANKKYGHAAAFFIGMRFELTGASLLARPWVRRSVVNLSESLFSRQ